MSYPALDEIKTMLRDGPLSLSMPPEESRAIFNAMFAEVPNPEGVIYEAAQVGGVEGTWARPSGAPTDQAILYAHGGAYVIGSPDTYAATIGHLALFSGLNIFAPNYRKAPENPYPVPVQDVVDAYRGLLDSGVRQVVAAGDSAGGGLTMSLLLTCKAEGLTMPVAGVLWSPWVNLACDSESCTFNAEDDPSLDVTGLVESARHYLGDNIPDDDVLHPLRADLSGLPPLLIHVGSIEILLDDATELAAEAGAAGVRVSLDIYPDMPHVFQSFYPALIESGEALEATAAFIKSNLKAGQE